MTTMNSRLKNLVVLSSNVKVYVPSTVDVDTPVDTTEWVRKAEALLAGHFGGSTTYKAIGCWVSPASGLVRETVTIVEAHGTEANLEAGVDAVIEFAEKMKVELKNDAVAIEVNGKLYLV